MYQLILIPSKVINNKLVHLKSGMSRVYFIIGVTCCGKTTIGRLLAKQLNIPFYDGDDHHPASNISKMESGVPLEDEDRIPWLRTLNKLAQTHLDSGAVIACSALKQEYREILKTDDKSNQIVFVFLHASKALISSRIHSRKEHFMSPTLIQSQFDILEEPVDALKLEAGQNPNEQVQLIKDYYELK
jgi:carbohydrate kinase (thermoresistant glucokinase family)